MRLAILFSGGKDSTYAAYLASKEHKIVCLLSMISKNPDSYMFHTPNINLTTIQAKVMNLPLLTQSTSGEKEIEVKELKRLVQAAKRKYKIEGVVTGAIKSTYQATRIQKVCHELNLWCFNPLWQKDEITHLKDLIKNKFEVIISAVAAYPFDENSDIIKEIAWVFEPYTRARSFGKLDNANNNEIKQLIRSILTRIDKHCGGKSEKINLDARYKIIYSNKNWYMVDEIGAYARMRLVKDGIKAFVSVKKRFDGNYNYVLLKTNPFILFPINEMYHKLNKIEKNKIEKWGGGDIIGGSPRITGSKIKPEEMIEIINKLFK